MSYNENNLASVVNNPLDDLQSIWRYESATDNLATITASGYFSLTESLVNLAPLMKLNDIINIIGSDGTDTVIVTGINPITVSTGADQPALAQGALAVGNAAGKMDALTGDPGNMVVYDSSGYATTQPVSGVVTMNDSAAYAFNGQVLEGSNVRDNGVDTTDGAIPLIFEVVTAGGATANKDIVVDYKIKVLSVSVTVNGTGTASDTIQVFNGTGGNAISDAIDINVADTTVVPAGNIDDLYQTISAGGTMRVTETDGGGSDSPACSVIITAKRVV